MTKSCLILGDFVLSKDKISKIKNKYNDFIEVKISLKDDNFDEIRRKIGTNFFDDKNKLVIIKDIVNQKKYKEFLSTIVNEQSKNIFIIWDSENIIKIDPKTKKFNKQWQPFIDSIPNTKIVDHGLDFSEKETFQCNDFIVGEFKKRGKKISKENAFLFQKIVGKKKGILISEINKFSLFDCEITKDLIFKLAYPVSQESILYLFSNIIDEGNIQKSLLALDEYLDTYNVHPNVISEILMKKARWQMACAYIYKIDGTLNDASSKITQMGSFPSFIWEQNISYKEKKDLSEKLKSKDELKKHYIEKLGYEDYHFKFTPDFKLKPSERIPMSFMSQQTCDFFQKSIINRSEKGNDFLNIAMRNYIDVSESFKMIRFDYKNHKRYLYQMIKSIYNYSI
jgi:DNA polymerase III delta subunit